MRFRLFFVGLVAMPILAVGIFFLLRGRVQEKSWGVVPNLTLTERSGKRFTLGALQGKIWVASFLFTRCTGQCPLMTAQMSRLQGDLLPYSQVRLVSFTVDPEHDTPRRLASYADQWGANPEKWLFLRASKDELKRLLNESFRLTGASQASKDDIDHSSKFAIVDRWGKIRGYYDGTLEKAVPEIVSHVKKLLNERF